MTTRVIAGHSIEFDGDGFMADPSAWNRTVAAELAQEIGIESLSDGHWRVIDFVREEYRKHGEAPTLRRIMKVGGVPTKELYKLFPKGPAKKVALVSGLSKPKGCI